MAKKSGKHRPQANRRPVAPAPARQAAPVAASRPTVAPSGPRPSAQASQPAPAPSTADLANEYRYVLGDLRRVGILAISMFALLVAIALVAQFVIK